MHASSEVRNGRSYGCGTTSLGEQVAALQYESRNTHADFMPSEAQRKHFRSVSSNCTGKTADTTCVSSAQPKTEVRIASLHRLRNPEDKLSRSHSEHSREHV